MPALGASRMLGSCTVRLSSIQVKSNLYVESPGDATSARRTFPAVDCTFPSPRLMASAGSLEALIILKMRAHVSR